MKNLEAPRSLMARKTYLKGKFVAKYWAKRKAAGHQGPAVFSLNLDQSGISSLEIRIDDFRREEAGPFPETPAGSELSVASLPDRIRCLLSSETEKPQYFSAKIHDPRLQNIALIDVERKEDRSFGTLTGEIYCHLIDLVPVEDQVPELAEEEIGAPGFGPVDRPGHSPGPTLPGILQEHEPAAIPQNCNEQRVEAPLKPVDKESDAIHVKPVPDPAGQGSDTPKADLWAWLLCGLLLLLILLAGWPAVLSCLAVFAVIWILDRIERFIRKTLPVLMVVGLVLAGLVLISFFRGPDKPEPKPQHDLEKPVKKVPESLDVAEDTLVPVQVISHYHQWEDYQGRQYAGWLKVADAAYQRSAQHHRQLAYSVATGSDFGRVYKTMAAHDSAALALVCSLFDSLQASRELNRIEFANMVVSCVQQIPYTLILPGGCQPEGYNDQFIQRYLLNQGSCQGGIPYGVQSPVEFVATLQGDCDTRTLLLYTILRHYGYEVEILNSDVEKHSMLGICLPLSGSFLLIDNKRYYFWETTARGMLPGQLPHSFTNSVNWYPVTL